MKKTLDVFKTADEVLKKITLKKNVDFSIVDFHETASEKMAMGHFFDGHITCLVGTHTHVPTSDTRILDKGTAYQTDLGMCGDYNSVIDLTKKTHSKDFLKKDAVKHFPSEETAPYQNCCRADKETGLAKKFLD